MFEAFKHVLADAAPHPEEPQWARVRKPPRHCDEALTGTARHWLRRLPGSRRPLRLCMDYPRVANRLAWCWSDEALIAQVLDDLLVDKRGGRRGFPPAVMRELQRLRDFNLHQRADQRGHQRGDQRADSPDTSIWSALRRALGAG